MNSTEILDKLAKKSKLTDIQRYECTKHLWGYLSSDGDVNQLAEYLVRFDKIINIRFFTEYINKMSPEQFQDIHQAMRQTDVYKNNVKYTGTMRGFICYAMAEKENNIYAEQIFIQSIIDVAKSQQYPDTLIKCFKENVEKILGIEKTRALMDKYSHSEVIINFLNAIYYKIYPANNPLIPKPNENIKPTIDYSPVTATDGQANKLYIDIKTIHYEVNEIINALKVENGTIAFLRKEVLQLKTEISSLQDKIKDKNNELKKYHEDITKKDDEIKTLNEKLVLSMQMDLIAQNQEILTLKNSLIKTLKLEYDDLLNLKNLECSKDNYNLLISCLEQVFLKLKRFDIIFE